ncbi:MAG: hypothetical protein AABZ47_18570 [Planctomycetota bacterium]
MMVVAALVGCVVSESQPGDITDESVSMDEGDSGEGGTGDVSTEDGSEPPQGEPIPNPGTDPPVDVNPDEETTSDGSEPALCEIRTSPFGDNEAWTITSSTAEPESPFLNMMGRGLTIDSIDLYQGGVDGSGCSSTSVDGDVSFDGTTLRINAALSNSPMGAFGGTFVGPCSLQLVGTVADCGSSEVGFLEFNLFEVTFSGSVVVGDASVELSFGQLMRIQFRELIPCEESPRSLEGLNWSLTNIDLSTIGIPTTDETGGEVSISIMGFGNAIDYADLFASPSTGGSPSEVDSNVVICSGTPPGTVVFNGQSLVLDVSFGEIATLPIDGDVPPTSKGDECAVQFNGAVSSCETLTFPAPFGGPETALTILTLDGVGTYASGSQRGRLSTLFLILTPTPDGTGGETGTEPRPEVPTSPPP